MATVRVPKNYKQAQAEYHAEITRLAELCFRMQCENPARRVYVLGRRSPGVDSLNPRAAIWTELTIGTGEDCDGWEGVHGQHLSPAHTLDHLYSDIKTILGREPLWIFAD